MRGNLCIKIICCQRSSAISKKMMKDECNESSTENVCKLPSTVFFRCRNSNIPKVAIWKNIYSKEPHLTNLMGAISWM